MLGLRDLHCWPDRHELWHAACLFQPAHHVGYSSLPPNLAVVAMYGKYHAPVTACLQVFQHDRSHAFAHSWGLQCRLTEMAPSSQRCNMGAGYCVF